MDGPLPAEFDFLDDPVLAARLVVAGVRAADCDERFVLGGGPGGQKVNKTASTVHLRHRPSGVEVRMQRERSQARNRRLAWEELARRIEERRAAAAALARDAAEKERRRRRQKRPGQKAAMIRAKRHRADIRAVRRVSMDE